VIQNLLLILSVAPPHLSSRPVGSIVGIEVSSNHHFPKADCLVDEALGLLSGSAKWLSLAGPKEVDSCRRLWDLFNIELGFQSDSLAPYSKVIDLLLRGKWCREGIFKGYALPEDPC
jgi:hypothetical protein